MRASFAFLFAAAARADDYDFFAAAAPDDPLHVHTWQRAGPRVKHKCYRVTESVRRTPEEEARLARCAPRMRGSLLGIIVTGGGAAR